MLLSFIKLKESFDWLACKERLVIYKSAEWSSYWPFIHCWAYFIKRTILIFPQEVLPFGLWKGNQKSVVLSSKIEDWKLVAIKHFYKEKKGNKAHSNYYCSWFRPVGYPIPTVCWALQLGQVCSADGLSMVASNARWLSSEGVFSLR